MPPLDLLKTVELPDDAAQAKAKFEDMIHNKPYVVLVALGEGAEAESVVQTADNLTGDEDEPRWVCWAKTPAHIQGSVAALPRGAELSNRLATTRAFSISLTDEVRDEIPNADPVPDRTRVNLCFTRAETAQANG